jgi:hypothetical protein
MIGLGAWRSPVIQPELARVLGRSQVMEASGKYADRTRDSTEEQ